MPELKFHFMMLAVVFDLFHEHDPWVTQKMEDWGCCDGNSKIKDGMLESLIEISEFIGGFKWKRYWLLPRGFDFKDGPNS